MTEVPRYEKSNIIAYCPDCNAITTFLSKQEGRELGYHQKDIPGGDRTMFDGSLPLDRIIYRLFACSTCQRGGLGTIHGFRENRYSLQEFYPRSVERHSIPEAVPHDVLREYREAEDCLMNGQKRAASAMARSTLEKILSANGYNKVDGTLYHRIEKACGEGVLLAARKTRAHENIRSLGNDILHEDWGDVSEEEVLNSLKYTSWILNDLYDDRPTVEAQLKALGRIVEQDEGTNTQRRLESKDL